MALRLLIKNAIITSGVSLRINNSICKRDSSYRSSPIAQDPSHYTKYEVSSSPEEWKFVERLLPLTIIPPPPDGKNFPSGWQPQTAKFGQYPYFVHRTRNHMLPVYLKVSMRGTRRITQINNVDGDIWKLEEALKKYLQKVYGDKRIIATKVHEVCGHLCIHGDHVSRVNEWLLKKGL
ncbi:probable 39S ribosomal protein L49, mitochondrial [Sipha flava]|uniref:Large ribosomal subunit protein mL49 n=1 Tax=Sipha flava TaxID=143950 RepID=A0A8B8FGU2_9HEMI|nr:probable 39S ribosomal protein L49, mitochondrial [Sipha flava]